MKWHIKYGKWWMIQWQFASWISIGIHIDVKTKVNSITKIKYAPYIDIHFLFFIFSLGLNPYESLAEIHKR